MALTSEHHIPGIAVGPADGSAPPSTGLTLTVTTAGLGLSGPDPAQRRDYTWDQVTDVTPVGVWVDPAAGPLSVLRLVLGGVRAQIAGPEHSLTRDVVDSISRLSAQAAVLMPAMTLPGFSAPAPPPLAPAPGTGAGTFAPPPPPPPPPPQPAQPFPPPTAQPVGPFPPPTAQQVEPVLVSARPRRRGRLPVIALVTLLALAGLGGGIWLGTASNSSPSPASSAPGTAPGVPNSRAARLFAEAKAATGRARSFSYEDSSTVSGVQSGTQSQTGIATPSSGYQVNYFPQGVLDELVLNGSVYAKGDAGALQNQLGLSQTDATTYAQQWIALAPGDAPTSAVEAGTTIPSIVQENFASTAGATMRPASASAPHVVAGVRVITISGTITVTGRSNAGGLSGRETFTLVVRAAAPHLPISLLESGSGVVNGAPVSQRSSFKFLGWDGAAVLPTPAGAIPYASIPSARSQS